MSNVDSMQEERNMQFENNERRGRIWTGIFFLIVGGVALARSFMVPIPEWLFNWQTLLITIGFFIGIRNNFQGAAWLILIIIGCAFLLNDYFFAGGLRDHTWPVILIVLGIMFILRPIRNSLQKKRFAMMDEDNSIPRDDKFADLTIIFGSSKKKIQTPDFSGGDITAIFGGAELNLIKADIKGKVHIDVTAICGGVDLIIPSDWTIQSELVTIMGAVKDNREQLPMIQQNAEKVVVLDGTVMMGGIQIRSFEK
ncbi:MAG: LiaF-related protein [Chitinophagaceae bacterium]